MAVEEEAAVAGTVTAEVERTVGRTAEAEAEAAPILKEAAEDPTDRAEGIKEGAKVCVSLCLHVALFLNRLCVFRSAEHVKNTSHSSPHTEGSCSGEQNSLIKLQCNYRYHRRWQLLRVWRRRGRQRRELPR